MDIKVNTRDGMDYASVAGDRELIFDGQTALDLIMTVRYETGCDRVAIGKEAFSETFFTLSSGLAGEVLQKFINYRMRLAIVGDFSRYTSVPLRDLIRECNRGRDIFFVSTQAEAGEKLCAQ